MKLQIKSWYLSHTTGFCLVIRNLKVIVVCTLHDWSATGGQTLQDVSPREILDEPVWSPNYVLSWKYTQEVTQEITWYHVCKTWVQAVCVPICPFLKLFLKPCCTCCHVAFVFWLLPFLLTPPLFQHLSTLTRCSLLHGQLHQFTHRDQALICKCRANVNLPLIWGLLSVISKKCLWLENQGYNSVVRTRHYRFIWSFVHSIVVSYKFCKTLSLFACGCWV